MPPEALDRRRFLKLGAITVAAGGLVGCGSKAHSATATGPSSAIALTRVDPDGLKFTAVALAYPTEIASSNLSTSDFAVQGRTITRVYANTTASEAEQGRDGRYVILELSLKDSGAALWPSMLASGNAGANLSGSGARPSGGPPSGGGPPSSGSSGATGSSASTGSSGSTGSSSSSGAGPGGSNLDSSVKAASAKARQKNTIKTTSGSSVSASSVVKTSREIKPIVDSFKQATYKDPVNGNSLAYNFYVPDGYEKTKKYPLVLFMPDATVTGTDPLNTLCQGVGAVIWASPADQAKRPAFVLAPQYASTTVDNDGHATNLGDTTVRLMRALMGRYSIDPDRLYNTGQSGGAILAMAMDIKYPDLFAASMIVAGQYDPTLVKPMAHKPLFIVVSVADQEAYPTQNKDTKIWAQAGATVRRATWNAKAGTAALEADARALIAKKADINYASFTKGSVIPSGAAENAVNEHLCTWRVAYSIEPIREWLFTQRRAS